jgi:hypothetical protein
MNLQARELTFMIKYVKWTTATQVLEEHYTYVYVYRSQSRGHDTNHTCMSSSWTNPSWAGKNCGHFTYVVSVNNMPRSFVSVPSYHTVRLVDEHQKHIPGTVPWFLVSCVIVAFVYAHTNCTENDASGSSCSVNSSLCKQTKHERIQP